ncbi:hypothetical protein EIN_194500 [Entamoeba invadens IP1]|uniref:Uncharacterized protein n=1 Tax=Entamoeba invadens IP1 TaxID=370355 RepID=A0A0A1U3I3_ENTIV|nr:hypothetical protein EIN_194500 [Entamoeba invadens IP1]ELP88701.1 hypothetical protein EIN_194500 [Entamoeba invadens IP1]|eukprot:XP_004255472.1 hypothetical protein EIN_194500 [Entamoeba invadens IP1]
MENFSDFISLSVQTKEAMKRLENEYKVFSGITESSHIIPIKKETQNNNIYFKEMEKHYDIEDEVFLKTQMFFDSTNELRKSLNSILDFVEKLQIEATNRLKKSVSNMNGIVNKMIGIKEEIFLEQTQDLPEQRMASVKAAFNKEKDELEKIRKTNPAAFSTRKSSQIDSNYQFPTQQKNTNRYWQGQAKDTSSQPKQLPQKHSQQRTSDAQSDQKQQRSYKPKQDKRTQYSGGQKGQQNFALF